MQPRVAEARRRVQAVTPVEKNETWIVKHRGLPGASGCYQNDAAASASSVVAGSASILEYVDPFDVGGTKSQQHDAAILAEWCAVYDHERIVRGCANAY